MSMTKIMQIRVSKSQYERIRNNAEAKGYKTIAAYMREQALSKDLVYERKFDEIYQNVKTLMKK